MHSNFERFEHLAHASHGGGWEHNGGPLAISMKAGASIGSIAGPGGAAVGAIAGGIIGGLIIWNWARRSE